MFYYESKAIKNGYNVICGLDEVGRGALSGPVVTAAVILKEKKFKHRIYDSKCLSAHQREEAFFEIVEKTSFAFGIVNETIIDAINILKATKKAFELAVLNLKTKPDYLLIDGNIDLNLEHPLKKIIKGDTKSLSIACASIIAKVYRDRIMNIYHKIYPNYNFNKNKGYGTKEHFKYLKKFGPCPIHRKTFIE
ncbi:MAG: ribonuclease HII [Candidatus Omnitrophota bacterium]